MKLTTAMLSLSLCAAAACTGGDDSSQDPIATADAAPAGPTTDASTTTPPPPPPPQADAAPYTCGVPDDLGDLGNLAGGDAIVAQDMDGNLLIELPLALAAAPGSTLVIQLWEGYGAFAATKLADVTTPLTIPIAGDEANLELCGACAFIVDEAGETPALFAAASGSIALTALDPTAGTGTLAGSLTNVAFAHVDAETLAPIADDCDTRVGAASFSATIVAAPEGP